MAQIKKISTELQLLDKFLDTSGDAGTSGQVLTSTGTGINWVSGGSLPGGPYLPVANPTFTGTITGPNANITSTVTTSRLAVNGTANAIELNQSATGSATYYVMDNTVETGGKRYRFGYSGGSSDKGSFSIYNQTDNIMPLLLSGANATFAGNVTAASGTFSNLTDTFFPVAGTGGLLGNSILYKLNYNAIGLDTTARQFYGNNFVTISNSVPINIIAGLTSSVNLRGNSADILVAKTGGNVNIPNGSLGIGMTSNATQGKLDILNNGDYDSHTGHGLTINSSASNAFTSMYMGADDSIDAAYIQSAGRNTSFTSKKLLLNPNGGNVGINNSSPNEKLSVRGNIELVGENVGNCGIRYIKYNCPDDSSYNVLGLETSGLTIYNRALMPSNGAIIFQNQSNNNQYYIRNSGGTNATFQVGQGAPGSNVRFFINGSGNVGIGNTASTSSVKLEVTGNTLLKNSNGVGDLYLGNYATANHFRFHTNNSNTYFDMNCGDIYWRQGTSTRYQFFASTANMTIQGTLTQNSDARTKENVVEISDCISKVQAMRGVYYNRTDFNTDVTKVGVIAQEVEAVLPELVLESPETGLKSVAYSELTSVLINAIKEQQEIIEDLKSRITKLEN